MGTSENLSLPDFQVFIKPFGPLCNLRCSYCYYLETEIGTPVRIMDQGILERLVKQQIDTTPGDLITFSWHGGEPMLAGLDFFRSALKFQKKYCPAEKKIINGIQTNGTLINEEWCRFLAEESFSVGISMDGPEILHNRFRKDKNGRGSYEQVLKGFDMLSMHGIDPEILCVVSAGNSDYPLEVYNFFRQLGSSFLTFIPLVEKSGDCTVSERSIDPLAFGRFLCSVFDVWIANDIGRIKIQIIEETLRTAFLQDHTLCIFRKQCGGVPVVEFNGNFYSCDHYVNVDNHIGNIDSLGLSDMLHSEKQLLFGRRKSNPLPAYCKNCEVLDMCNGECPKNRFIKAPDGEEGLNYLCRGYRHFFNHCRPLVEAVKKKFEEEV